MQVRNRSIVLQFFWVEVVLFSKGLINVSLNLAGNTPDSSDLLIRAVSSGSNHQDKILQTT